MRAVFLQARMGSTRYPGKALAPLAGKPVVAHCMEALRAVPADRHVMLTDEASAAALGPAAEAGGFDLFIGPAEDVLLRFALAVEAYGADSFLRATGDNPLVSSELASLLRDEASAGEADYGGFLGMPVGMGVEYVRGEALLRAARDATDPYEREHVCPHLYRNPRSFRLYRTEAPAAYLLDASVTFDTPEDYRRLEIIFAGFGPCGPGRSAELVAWLARDRSMHV